MKRAGRDACEPPAGMRALRRALHYTFGNRIGNATSAVNMQRAL